MPEFLPRSPKHPDRRVIWTHEEWTAAAKFLADNPHLDHTHLPDGTRMTVHYASARRKV